MLPFCNAWPSGTDPQLQKSLELLGMGVLLDVFWRSANILLPLEPDKLKAAEIEVAKMNIANSATKGFMVDLTGRLLISQEKRVSECSFYESTLFNPWFIGHLKKMIFV